MKSVAAQSYKEIEVLLIDDCGTDGTFNTVDNFLKQYNGDIPFRIIKHEHNKGVSAARNTGIRNAKGEYLYFLDSDDSISANCIETLLRPFADDASVEMVIGNYKIIGPLNFAPFALSERSYTSSEIIEAEFSDKLYGMPWNKLIRKDVILRNGLFFIEGIIHEDLLWNYYCSMCLNKMYVVQRHTYNYYVHPNSITTSDDKLLHQRQMVQVMTYLLDFIFKGNAPDKKEVCKFPTVYKHVERLLATLIMDPAASGNEAEARSRYNELRDHSIWGLRNVMGMKGVLTKHKTRYLHHLLPKDLGYLYYRHRNLKHHNVLPETNNMKITVITINYNNLEGLRRTIPSIVTQTYNGYEFIVIDGGSTDGSKEYIASEERIDQWVSEPDSGVYNAMNKAVGMAHGDYCIFMNSGDTFFSAQALEQCVGGLGETDFACGRSIFIEPQNAYPFIPPQTMSYDFLFCNSLNHQALFTKTEVLRKMPFSEKHRITSDWEQFFEAWFMNDCTYTDLDATVSIYYMDGMSTTNKDVCEKERHETIMDLIKRSGEKGKTLERYYKHYQETGKLPDVQAGDYIGNGQYVITERRRKRMYITECLRGKLKKSLTKKSPIQRDLGVIRYGFKYLFKDLFL